MYLYGQYCPVARASEILADRWTPLIVRELLAGLRHFKELDRGLPASRVRCWSSVCVDWNGWESSSDTSARRAEPWNTL
jgi:hypothetical protein